MTAVRRVSIVIPTLNGGVTLERLLAALDEQDGDVEREVIALDSCSTDETRDVLRAHGATIIDVPPGTFDHGETRNAGLKCAAGEFAVLIVQDAVPAGPRWLVELVRPMLDDQRVAGTFARQQPWPGASALTRHYLARWVAAGDEPRTVGPLPRATFEAMRPAERHLTCVFDNVCSCIRMSVWREHPFRATAIGEDLEWAREVLLAGHRLVYTPSAVVCHSHDRTVRHELQRTYLVHQRLQTLFGLSTVPDVPSLLRAIAGTLPQHVRIAASEPRARLRAIARATALAVAWPLGQYLGARSAREGRALMRVRGV